MKDTNASGKTWIDTFSEWWQNNITYILGLSNLFNELLDYFISFDKNLITKFAEPY